jgi:hypothetical protein
MKTQLTIIGTNHGKGTSRIWLEGKRLVEAGFEVGTRYDRNVIKAKDGWDHLELRVKSDGKFKVSGKGDKPIIDISGKAVTETFREAIESYLPRVVVIKADYSDGKVVLTTAGCR